MARDYIRALLFAAFAVSCSDEGTPEPEADGGAETSALVDCTGIDVAAQLGQACANDLECDPGAACSVLGDDVAEGAGQCRQRCAPAACETICGEGELCVPLESAPAFGVCAALAPGARGNYETCSDDVGRCVDGLDCLVARDGDREGVCLQPCDEGLPCPTWNGIRARCVIDVDDPDGTRRYCAPECPEEGADDQCPGTMTCEEAGFLSVCAFGQP